MSAIDDISIPARAARLKQARLTKFPKASQAARALGLHPVTVRAHESAQNGFPIETAEMYANAYEVSATWLLMGSGGGPKRSDPAPGLSVPVRLTQLANGTARLELNTVLPFSVALQILALVQGDEK